MSELDKLEQYLKDKSIPYKRIDKQADQYGFNMHKIAVPSDGDDYQWDAICHRGSYGFEQGLLEICGSIVTEEDGDSVVGWLTADDVIKRTEGR